MIKIKASYEHPEELTGLIELLQPVILSYKVAAVQKGTYKRAYILVELRK